MSITKVGALAALGLLTLPGMALAGSFAVATHNVNVRAGPDMAYPVVDIARAGDQVYVFGCLEYRSWCDVDYDGVGGWISSRYLAFFDRGRRYVGPDAMYRMRAPIVTFSFGGYWDRHYRGRPFYRERSRWENFYRGRPRADRPHIYEVPRETRPGAARRRDIAPVAPEPEELSPRGPEPRGWDGERRERREWRNRPDRPYWDGEQPRRPRPY
jgi:uncharacterized protein YraI